jgi:hypothetical protein
MRNFIILYLKTYLNDLTFLIPTVFFGLASFPKVNEEYPNIIRMVSNLCIAWNLWLWIGGLMTFFIVSSIKTYGRTIKQNKNEEEQRKNEIEKCRNCILEREEDYYTRFSTVLRRISRKLEFSESNQRISVYKYDDEKKWFVMHARFSSDPVYNLKGRVFYPSDQGIIKKAWRDGMGVILLPDPEKQLNEYYKQLERDFGMSQSTTKNIRMKSSFYFALGINGKDEQRIAVIVFECTRIQKREFKKIKVFLEKQIKDTNCLEEIRNFILDNIKSEPSQTYAGREGV